MFWRILAGVLKTSITLHRTVTALGAATIIIVSVHDYMKKRKN